MGGLNGQLFVLNQEAAASLRLILIKSPTKPVWFKSRLCSFPCPENNYAKIAHE
jgi:hypothetical protein